MLSKGIREISKSCFEGCENLEDISGGENLTGIRARAFSGCLGLKALALPSKCWQISPAIFNGCNLDEIVIIAKKGSPAAVFAGRYGFMFKEE